MRAAVAVASEPADGDAVTDTESRHPLADFGYDAGNLVSGSQWPRRVRECAMDELAVGSAHTAGAHLDPDVIGWGRGGLGVGELKRSTGGIYVNGAVGSHVSCPRAN